VEEQQTCATVAAHDPGLAVADASREREEQLERDGWIDGQTDAFPVSNLIISEPPNDPDSAIDVTQPGGIPCPSLYFSLLLATNLPGRGLPVPGPLPAGMGRTRLQGRPQLQIQRAYGRPNAQRLHAQVPWMDWMRMTTRDRNRLGWQDARQARRGRLRVHRRCGAATP
jgi:hypothetical protein